MRVLRLLFIIFILALFIPVTLSGLELDYKGMDGEIGFLWKHNEGYDRSDGDSGPDLFTFFPGVSAFFTFNENWFFKPSLFLYNQTMRYIEDYAYAIPEDISHAGSMNVLALMIEPSIGYSWVVRERHTFGVQSGLGFNLQIPLWGPGSDDRSDMQTALLKEWLYINPGFWYYNPLTDRFGFTFRTEVNLPVYNLFMNRGLSFSDGLTVMAMVGIRVIVQ
ncbi:MAG: hypothetical protein B6241_08405 [Spirochaetaceae bacterium 4572_59]|nr:MAG: hypothetical protein B6241_08405 [Spirochaetaceae bacterium 4572_59]